MGRSEFPGRIDSDAFALDRPAGLTEDRIAVPHGPKKSRSTRKNAKRDPWRLADLDPAHQKELRRSLAEAERGEGLTDFDEAMEDVREMTDAILAARR